MLGAQEKGLCDEHAGKHLKSQGPDVWMLYTLPGCKGLERMNSRLVLTAPETSAGAKGVGARVALRSDFVEV